MFALVLTAALAMDVNMLMASAIGHRRKKERDAMAAKKIWEAKRVTEEPKIRTCLVLGEPYKIMRGCREWQLGKAELTTTRDL